jgi:hypothetical protein
MPRGFLNGITATTVTATSVVATSISGSLTVPLNGTTQLSGLTIGTKKVFVGSTTPTGMAAGDIWIQV